MTTATYPPGVLTGRPMMMFGASQTLDLYATPEQWVVEEEGAIEELCDALRMRDLALDLEVDNIEDLLLDLEPIPDGDWIELCENGCSPRSTLRLRDGGIGRVSVANALDQFEEDLDYEEFIKPSPLEEEEREMEEALDGLDQRLEEEMDWITQQLAALERYQDQTAYYMYPMVHRDGGVAALYSFTAFGIKESLEQFEEDHDYEEWINSKQYINSLKESNRHKLLSWDKYSETMHPQWAGIMTSAGNAIQLPGLACRRWSDPTLLHGVSLKDRYDVDVEIVTHHPSDRRGYAKGTTDYGDVYIPFKFWKYLPSIGDTTKMTIALQDVGDSARPANGFRWTAIHQHNGVYR
jgi:hypothetical protein